MNLGKNILQDWKPFVDAILADAMDHQDWPDTAVFKVSYRTKSWPCGYDDTQHKYFEARQNWLRGKLSTVVELAWMVTRLSTPAISGILGQLWFVITGSNGKGMPLRGHTSLFLYLVSLGVIMRIKVTARQAFIANQPAFKDLLKRCEAALVNPLWKVTQLTAWVGTFV